MNFNLVLRPRDTAIKYSSGLCPSALTDDIQGHRSRSNADDTFQVVIISSFDLLCKSTVRCRIANGAVEWEIMEGGRIPRANRAV